MRVDIVGVLGEEFKHNNCKAATSVQWTIVSTDTSVQWTIVSTDTGLC